jgi:hypothetical protein
MHKDTIQIAIGKFQYCLRAVAKGFGRRRPVGKTW